jgi:hypothetical protein
VFVFFIAIVYSPYHRYDVLRRYAENVDSRTPKQTQLQTEEPLKIGHYFLGPLSGRQKQGVTAYEFIVYTNRVMTPPVRLALTCDVDLVDVSARMLGISGLVLGGLERIDAKQYEIGTCLGPDDSVACNCI